MPFTISPDAKFTGLDDEGAIVPGGKLYTYAAGTTTPLATFADSSGTSNANPLILDSAGRATIYLGAFSYKFVFKDASDVQLWSQDNISDAALIAATGDIVGTTDTQTLTNKTLTSPIINGATINTSTLNSPTEVTPVVTGGTFTGPTIATPTFSTGVAFQTRVQFQTGATIVTSTNILTLGNDGNVFAIDGGAVLDALTTTGWQAGSVVILLIIGSPTFNYNTGGPVDTAPFILQGGANLIGTNLTALTLVYTGAQWWEVTRSVNHS